jgi:hypothetical protein
MKEKTWELEKRLLKRKHNKETNFWRNPTVNYEDINNFHTQQSKDIDVIKRWFRNKYWEKETTPWRQIRQDKYIETKQRWKDSPLYLKE